jgi:hypothetical protein
VQPAGQSLKLRSISGGLGAFGLHETDIVARETALTLTLEGTDLVGGEYQTSSIARVARSRTLGDLSFSSGSTFEVASIINIEAGSFNLFQTSILVGVAESRVAFVQHNTAAPARRVPAAHSPAAGPG